MAAKSVAVIGLGAAGVVAVKNLVEEGFEVTGFERNRYVGGIWTYAKGPVTSVLESTIANLSKERGCFTDFPFPKDCPLHPSAQHIQQYLEDYVEHFSLRPHLRMGTAVQQIRYDEERKAWGVTIAGPGEEATHEYFDKVLVANGNNRKSNIPATEGIELFRGKIVDAQSFKKPEDFDGQKVLVVGFSNTAADTSTGLVGHADKIYLSHRNGSIILPRIVDGKALDRGQNLRITAFQSFLATYVPSLSEKLTSSFVKKVQNKSFDILPEWRMDLMQPLEQSLPMVSDTLISSLREGSVESVAGLKSVTGENTVELSDNTELKVDSIIFCTGYQADFSFLGDLDPLASSPEKWTTLRGTNNRPPPRLYQNTFSLEHPDSLAFASTAQSQNPAFITFDLTTMAITQVWKGTSKLPSHSEMTDAVNAHHEWVRMLTTRGSVYPFIVKPIIWTPWVNDMAGTGVNENLGYGWNGWRYWLFNRRFCSVLMGGVLSPHIYRLFEGKRKAWKGAKEAILYLNGLDDL